MDDNLEDEKGGEESIAHEVQEKLKRWENHYGDWVEEAMDNYDMVAGHQWDDDAIRDMEDKGRPVITMNRIAALVRGICGLEVSNRQEAQYLPRGVEDSGLGELLNGSAKYFREQCDAEDEESEAFRDMVICGLGWTDTVPRYDNDPQGELIVERVDPLHMRWDPAARKRSLADAKWRARVKKMDLETIKSTWPEKADEIGVYFSDHEKRKPHDQTNAPWYNGRNAEPDTRPEVVQFQCEKTRKVVKVMDMNGQTADVSLAKAVPLAESGAVQIVGEPVTEKYYMQYVVYGMVELEVVEIDGFSFEAMTGQRDRNKGTWYGVVNDTIDPQKWSNKFFSSMIDSIARSAKGGLIAEKSAFIDPRKAEEVWSDASGVVMLKDGGLGKVQERNAPPLPQNMVQAMEFAVTSLPQITGINLEFLGLANRAQAGVLEQQRKQSVVSSLAEYFASLRQYRKRQGRHAMKLIMKYFADGRMIRIAGPNGPQNVQLPSLGEVKYDVIVDESPASADVKQRTWETVNAILPVALKAGINIPPEVLDYAPLPSSLAMKWKEALNGGLPPQVKEQMQKMQEEMAQLKQENDQLKQDTQAEVARITGEHRLKMTAMTAENEARAKELLMDYKSMMEEIELKRQRLEEEMALRREQADEEIRLMWARAEAEAALRKEAQEAREEIERKKLSWTIKKQNGKAVEATSNDGRKVSIKHTGDSVQLEED